MTLITTTPHTNPVSGNVTCEWSSDFGGQTTIQWTPGDPSAFGIAYAMVKGFPVILDLFDGDVTTLVINGTGPEDEFAVQFAIFQDGQCYGSELVTWSASSTGPGPFVRGDCDGDGQVTGVVTDSVFQLTLSFLNSSAPTCDASCDSNGDGIIAGDVGDAVHTLTFNFLNGPAPVDPFPDCSLGTRPDDAALGCANPFCPPTP